MKGKKLDPTLANISLTGTKGRGRKSKYNFWDIPVDDAKCRILENTDVHRVTSAKNQFERTYGGRFTTRSLDNGQVAVWCLEEPDYSKRPF